MRVCVPDTYLLPAPLVLQRDASQAGAVGEHWAEVDNRDVLGAPVYFFWLVGSVGICFAAFDRLVARLARGLARFDVQC